MKQLKNSTKSSSQSYRQGSGTAGWSFARAPQAETEAVPKFGTLFQAYRLRESFLLDSGVHVLWLVLDQEPLSPSSRSSKDLPPSLLPTQDGSFCPHGQQTAPLQQLAFGNGSPD